MSLSTTKVTVVQTAQCTANSAHTHTLLTHAHTYTGAHTQTHTQGVRTQKAARKPVNAVNARAEACTTCTAKVKRKHAQRERYYY